MRQEEQDRDNAFQFRVDGSCPSGPRLFGSSVVWIGGPNVGPPGVESTLLSALGLNCAGRPASRQALGELREHPATLCLLDCTRGGEALRIARSIRTERPRAVLIGVVDPQPPGDLARGVPRGGVRHPAVAARAVGTERRHLQRAGPAGLWRTKPDVDAGSRAGVAVRHLRQLAGDAEDRRRAAARRTKSLPGIALRRARHRTRDARARHSRSRPPARRAVCRRSTVPTPRRRISSTSCSASSRSAASTATRSGGRSNA